MRGKDATPAARVSAANAILDRGWGNATQPLENSSDGTLDAVVLKAVATTLNSFGIDEEDRKELKADFQHLRRWRRSVEQAQSYTFKAVITVIVTGFVGAVWLGIKATLGK
jgi:single-stranded DNA-binding protein